MHPRSILPLAKTRVVVTGASSGIGRAVAIFAASSGAESIVVHCHRNRAGADQTADEMRASDCTPQVLSCDLADASERANFVDRCFTTLTTIDAWIHCAGADVLTGEAADWSFDEKLRHLIDVDLIGSIATGRLVGSRLRDQASADPRRFPASMVFIGWDQATCGMEGDAGQMFGPIKAGVEAFAKSLAQDLAPTVRVNTIAPGWIQTEWGKTTSGYWNDRALNQSLMHRWGTPQDVAAAAIFLATPTNDFITGQTLDLNGGWNRTMKK